MTDELRRLAEAARDAVHSTSGGLCEELRAVKAYEAAANPTAIIALLDERDTLRAKVDRIAHIIDVRSGVGMAGMRTIVEIIAVLDGTEGS